MSGGERRARARGDDVPPAPPAGRALRSMEAPWRPLKVFAFDPSKGRATSNIVTLRIPHEPLREGPVGELVAVVDPGFEPVMLDSPEITLRGGLDPSDINFQFRQQMVYAVAMRTISDFQRGLGRRVRWPWDTGRGRIDDRLRMFPHGIRQLNAFFQPADGSVYFGYDTPFKDSRLPSDQYVFGCLSYDVVAHQTLHALHLALLPHYGNAFDDDSFAFLEGLDDLVCILQHFTFPDALLETVIGTRGRIDEVVMSDDERTRNPLLEMAPQLAEALGLEGGLRASLRDPPDPSALARVEEPHQRGTILTAAFLDAFFVVYRRRTRDLRAIIGSVPDDRELHPDLARRMAAEAAKTARHFLDIVTRSVDYCPPDGLAFGDFLRAAVTADAAVVPVDRWRYREAIIAACHARGIVPRGVSSLTEEGLGWPAVAGDRAAPEPCTGLDVRAAQEENVELLEPWVKRNRSALGLPGRGGLRIESVEIRAARGIGGGRVGRELAVRIMSTSSGRARGSVVILGEDGGVRHVISRSQSRRRTEPAGNPDQLPVPVDVVQRDLGGFPGPRPLGAFDRRPLQIFAFDPSRGRSLGNHLTLSVPYEELSPGPVGRKVAVVDYDASNDRYYDAVDLEDPAIVIAGGLPPAAGDPGFHQQMAYAVASATIERFEATLGRPVAWRWTRPDAAGPFANRLLIHPHAMQEANAYYDPTLHGLVFGYFAARFDADGPPTDQMVSTCLSHDIVVHETTHAVLDSIRRYFLEPTGPDAAAFHEGFADIVALLQHFSFPEALLQTIRRTGGRIHQASMSPHTAAGPEGPTIQAEIGESNPFVELAREFGEALGTRQALRSALGTRPDERALETTWEAHDRGAILVAAVFDAFFSVYVRSSADLLRMARAGGTINAAGDVHPALADRLAREATDAATLFTQICIRALDYCPPVDIEFGDFLRAIVTGHWDATGADDDGAIGAMVEAFRSRGIHPSGLRSFSEDELRWPRATLPANVRCEGLDPEPRDAEAWRSNAVRLRAFAKENALALGLSPAHPIRVHQMEAVASERIDPNGGLTSKVHAQFTQRRTEEFMPGSPSFGTFTFRGGSTVVLDATGQVRYVIAKPIDDPRRLARQRAYQAETWMQGAASAYVTGSVPTIDLAALHRGY